MSVDGALGTTTSPLLDSREVAAYLRVSESTLSRWRNAGGGPPFIRLGGVARYRAEVVDAWLTAQERDHDREEG